MTLYEIQQARDFLAAAQNSDGGWGYRVGNVSTTEPTALALLARPLQAAWEKGVAWSLATQKDDGGWGINSADDESNWLTAWAVWALLGASTERSLSAARSGADWLLKVPVAGGAGDPVAPALIGVTSKRCGWPWQSHGGAWVEPTALSVLVLFASGVTDHPRLREAIALLRERVCLGGGWNVGAALNFGKQMPPTPYATVLALLALQVARVDRDDPVIAESLRALHHMLTPHVAASTLAWGIIALRAWQADHSSLRDRLLERQATDGGWENSPYATATALLALQEQAQILRLRG